MTRRHQRMYRSNLSRSTTSPNPWFSRIVTISRIRPRLRKTLRGERAKLKLVISEIWCGLRSICENLRNLWMILEKDERSTDFSDFRRSRSLPATRNVTVRHTKDAQWSFIPGKQKESRKDA